MTVMAKPLDLAIVDQDRPPLDKAKAEVMIYLELLEVTETSLETVGLLPVLNATDTSGTYRIGATSVNNTNGLNTNSGGFTGIPTSNIRMLFPNLALDFLKSNGDARLVASPNVRVVSGEDRRSEHRRQDQHHPVQHRLPAHHRLHHRAHTARPPSLGGPGRPDPYSYEDVGVKIKVKPRVHFNGDITIDLESDVKTLKPDRRRPAGLTSASAVIKTSARLRDGETAIFGGLLKEDERRTSRASGASGRHPPDRRPAGQPQQHHGQDRRDPAHHPGRDGAQAGHDRAGHGCLRSGPDATAKAGPFAPGGPKEDPWFRSGHDSARSEPGSGSKPACPSGPALRSPSCDPASPGAADPGPAGCHATHCSA